MTVPIVDPGIYQIPLHAYINDPAPEPSLNAGAAHALLTESPLHCWTQHPRLNRQYQSDESSRLDLGTIAHALLLEGDDSRIVVVEADDWRTKAAKEQRDEARADGKLPILIADMEHVATMVSVCAKAIAASELASAWADGVSEETLIWEHEGVWCRSRPDRHSKDWRVLFDYKTKAGSANPAAFGKTILQQGYDLQAELGMQGVEKLVNPRDIAFVFVVQEIEPPYAVSFVSLNPQWIQLATDKLRMAMSLWKGCLRTGEWPAYPSRVAYLEPPAYALMGWEDHLSPIDAEDFI